MKVLNLRCANGHGFEGWFGSDDDYMEQNGRGQIECPMCADKLISRMPTAPRLNLSTSRQEPSEAARADAPGPPAEGAPALPQQVDLQTAWLHSVRHMMANTEDVGERFAEEARRIHYGEIAERGIRGQASPQEREALKEEGIETFAMPMPKALKGPVQ